MGSRGAEFLKTGLSLVIITGLSLLFPRLYKIITWLDIFLYAGNLAELKLKKPRGNIVQENPLAIRILQATGLQI